MTNTLSNHPRGTRGAFIEYSHSPSPLVVPFQFNPVQLQRSRSLSFTAPSGTRPPAGSAAQNNPSAQGNLVALQGGGLRKLHQDTRYKNLFDLHAAQQVEVQEETINLEIRFDATDGLNAGDADAEKFGIAPQLARLEQLVYPRDETLLGEQEQKTSDASKRFSYSKGPKPPLILFVWGSCWVRPVNINNINITESEFNTALYPLRATVTVNLTVIEGQMADMEALRIRKEMINKNKGVKYITDVVIPGQGYV